MKVSSKRAEYVSIASLALSALFFVVCLLVGQWSGFFAITAVSWLILAAAIICFVLTLQFHQRAQAEQEQLDIGLAGKGRETIFGGEGDQEKLFAVSGKRLEMLEKWFIPGFSLIIATYELGAGIWLFRNIQQGLVDTRQPLLCAVCMTAAAFFMFLMSRYAAGMSVQGEWKPIRAAGSFLFVAAILSFVLAVGLALYQYNIEIVVGVMNWVVPVVLIVLGAETAMNFVLDIYRPRVKGRYSRSAFDSRLLGGISEPGGIFNTVSSAIDYQFGFKVSQTWFYRLLERAIVPLILMSALVLYLLSCVVIVGPNEQAVIERFGNPLTGDGEKRIVGSGVAFKLPWPVDIAYKWPTEKVTQLYIGYVPETNEQGEEIYGPRLWGESHYKEEYKLLVASRGMGGAAEEGAVPVSLIMAAVPVQYKVNDIYAFLYNNSNAEDLLQSICYKELTEFAASAGIEVDEPQDLEESLLGAGRSKAKQMLMERIQKRADEEGLGVEVLFVGVQGLHPPPDVAGDYQMVIGAIQQKQAKILDAYAERNRTLSEVAGSVLEAERLHDIVTRYQRAQEIADAEGLDRAAKELDEAFVNSSGAIYERLRTAHSYAYERAALAEASGKRFAGQLKAYHAGGEIYTSEQRLRVFEDSLEGVRKYVIIADTNDMEVFIVDLTEKVTPSLYDIGVIEENK